MAKYKEYSYEQGLMIPVDFNKQIVPGTLEYTIHWLTVKTSHTPGALYESRVLDFFYHF